MDKNLKQLTIERNALLDLLFDTECGVKRREGILLYLKTHPEGLLVNRRYCLNLSKDNDLQYLLKKGKIYTVRVRTAGKTSNTYIRIV